MQIYIMRHGQADNKGNEDSLRELTVKGKFEVSVMAKWIEENTTLLDEIVVSPFVRAQQTAQILSDNLSSNTPHNTLNFITPSGSAQNMHDYIDGVSVANKVKSLVIVSHMPVVSFLVAELTFDNNSPIFQTAGIAHIDYDEKLMKGRLVGFIAPHDLS